MRKLTLVFAMIAIMLTPMVTQASATKITCKDYNAYQTQWGKLVANSDYMDDMMVMSEMSTDEIMSMTPKQLKQYGAALGEAAVDLESMKNIPASMKSYHAANTEQFQTMSDLFLYASNTGFFAAAMVYADKIETMNAEMEKQDATLPKNCAAN